MRRPWQDKKGTKITKLAATAVVLLVSYLGDARAELLDGKPVPLFPKLTWGLSAQAALSKGLQTYTNADLKLQVVGLPSVTINEIEFSAQTSFGRKDIRDVPYGLNYILLQHKDYVPTREYSNFLHAITNGFIYAGRGSEIGETSIFFNAVDGTSHIVVTSSNTANVSLSVAIAPGLSK